MIFLPDWISHDVKVEDEGMMKSSFIHLSHEKTNLHVIAMRGTNPLTVP
eukprot:UN16273